MKILVTGGAGYIGTELVHRLQEQQQVSQITIYDNLSRKNFNLFLQGQLDSSRVRFVQGDILDSRKLRQVMEGHDAVVHLAAKVTTPFASEDAHQFEQVNHWGTAEVAYAAEETGIKRLVYLSSTSVYGSGGEAKTATSEPNPDTYYGISKYRGEQHLERLQGRMQVSIFRCGNVYGFSPSMRFDAVINRFMFKGCFSGRLNLHGNGKQQRSFISVQQVVQAVEQALLQEFSGTYNLVQRTLSVLDIASEVKELYPQTEFLFINQHIQERNLVVEQDERLKDWLPQPEQSFAEELQEFAAHFAYAHPVQVG